ncbi:hypothetical protein Agub_g2115 [Astrephomene gubernaculifera]|uniref:RAP domain-containing protein n=1 Tax=Astrephomene gubernaculifera TaxID=47775 RepID=A0AAD3DH32_9CHLO|nr:hypothetical protein Agub_g2115 [Astrephomene gubernaculifera]
MLPRLRLWCFARSLRAQTAGINQSTSNCSDVDNHGVSDCKLEREVLPILWTFTARTNVWAWIGGGLLHQAFNYVPARGLAGVASSPSRTLQSSIRTRADTTFAEFSRAVKLPTRNADDLHRTLDKLSAAYLPLVPRLTEAHHCTIPLWACAKAGYWEGPLVTALLERLGQDGGKLLGQATGQNHANLWWSISKAPRNVVMAADGPLHASAASILRMSAYQFSSQDCSNILLACARLQRCHTPLLHHLTACLVVNQSEAACQALANSFYALGELAEDCGHKPQEQDLQNLAGAMLARLQSTPGQRPQGQDKALKQDQVFNPQQLANVLLGCVKLGSKDTSLLRPLAAAAGQAAGSMTEQSLSISLYALAVLGCSGGEYSIAVRQLCSEVHRRLRCRFARLFVPQSLSNILWALERLRPDDKEALMEALAAECRRRQFAGFKPQELSNAAWALAKMGYSVGPTRNRREHDWYKAAAEAASKPAVMKGARAQSWSNLWYALALVRHHPGPGLLLAMQADMHQNALRSSAGFQECANLLWSLASLGLYDQRLVDALGERMGELLGRQQGDKGGKGPTNQELANSLWALAVMGPDVLSRHSGLVEGLLREVVRRWEQQGSVGFEREELAQLWQVQQELEHLQRINKSQLHAVLAAGVQGAGSLLRAMEQAVKAARTAHALATTQLEAQVVQAVARLKQLLASGLGLLGPNANPVSGSSCPAGPAILAMLPEHRVDGVCGTVDIVLELAGGRRVAVEVDGPWHFLANHPHTRTKDGSTQLRDRHLERVFGAGNVVSVPYWEWNELKGAEAREQYLCNLLGLALSGNGSLAVDPGHKELP